MKKFLSVLLTACFIFLFTACQNEADIETQDKSQSENTDNTSITQEDTEDGIFSDKPFIATWKSLNAEHYITLKADGSFEAVYFAYDLQTQTVYQFADSLGMRTGTFFDVSPTMLSLTYDNGDGLTLIYEPNDETLLNHDENITFKPFEGEIPTPISFEEQLAAVKELMVGTWTSDTIDYVFTFSEDNMFTLENKTTGDVDSGLFTIDINGGYKIACEGEKYVYRYFTFENNTINLEVVEEVKVGSAGYERIEHNVILGSENIFTLEN